MYLTIQNDKFHVKEDGMIYEKVEKLCKEKGVSIYKAEKDMNLSPSAISKWKKSMPSAKTLKLLTEYFDVPVEYFLE